MLSETERGFSYTAPMSSLPPPIRPHEKDLGGGFVVRRSLPAVQRQAVGPFLFFDHFGPITAQPEDNHDVRAHPHIGLATVTYLFEGAMEHRDSTGVVQRIEPGAINWMTAGRGIVHSERTPADLKRAPRRMHGLQLWAALPVADEEMAPAFAHTPAAAIPALEVGGAQVRLLIGSAFGMTSPVQVRSETLYLDITLAAGDAFPLPAAEERAVYVVSGAATLDGTLVAEHTMQFVPAGEEPLLAAGADARVVLIGGAPLGHRHMWWNFVSSRKERLIQAGDDWAAGRFPAVPGETEFIPLPDKRPAA
jgi:redox-sensitive bicupin YhaK (pirin superfamily)